VQKFFSSYTAFKYSWVYCPMKGKLVHLNDLPIVSLYDENLNDFDAFALDVAKKFHDGLDFLGPNIDESIIKKIVSC